jgi:hypothetical protein
LSPASSSSQDPPRLVNAVPHRDDRRHRADISEPNYRLIARALLRRILGIERSLHIARPRPARSGPTKPDRADEVLARLAAVHKPGEPVGQAQMVAAGIPAELAVKTRQWAQAAGCWPYAQPRTGFAALQARQRQRKRGAS